MAVDIATQTFVLLKNNGVLPLSLSKIKSIAVIGPQGDNNSTISGDYSPDPSFIITPFDGIQSAANASGVTSTFTLGILITLLFFIIFL